MMSFDEAPLDAFEQAYPLDPAGKVEVNLAQGRVRVMGWDRPEVRLAARGSGVRQNLRINSQGSRFSLDVRPCRGLFGGLLSPRVDLELKVPQGAGLALDLGSSPSEVSGVHGQVTIDTGSGSVHCNDTGPLTVECGSGAVTVSRTSGRVSVETGSGDVRVGDVQGDVRIETGSGAVAVERVRGSVRTESGSGDIGLKDVAGDEARLDTSSGGVRLFGLRVRTLAVDTGSGDVLAELAAVDPGGSYNIETGSGQVELRLPPDARAALRVEARERGIDNALALGGVVLDDDELRGLLNGGGANVHVEAHGRVRIAAYGGVAEWPDAPPAPPAPAAPAAPPAPAVPAVPAPPAIGPVPPAPAAAVSDQAGPERAVAPTPDLSEEYRRVLKMVEEGKLKTEEADAILRALEEGTGEEPA